MLLHVPPANATTYIQKCFTLFHSNRSASIHPRLFGGVEARRVAKEALARCGAVFAGAVRVVQCAGLAARSALGVRILSPHRVQYPLVL